MKGCLRAFAFFLLVICGLFIVSYLYTTWQRIGKDVVVIMRSSNEDCDEFRRIWTIDRVLSGNLTAKESASACYLISSQKEYSKRDSVEWIKVEGSFTNEDKRSYYDCTGTLLFRDKSVKNIRANKNKRR